METQEVIKQKTSEAASTQAAKILYQKLATQGDAETTNNTTPPPSTRLP
jgi:hypothetical protein